MSVKVPADGGRGTGKFAGQIGAHAIDLRGWMDVKLPAPFVSRPPCPKAQTPCDARPLMLPEERGSARIRPHESEVEKEHSGCGWGWGEKWVRRRCRRVAVQERRKKMRTWGSFDLRD